MTSDEGSGFWGEAAFGGVEEQGGEERFQRFMLSA